MSPDKDVLHWAVHLTGDHEITSEMKVLLAS
jgi:hypothetical protein